MQATSPAANGSLELRHPWERQDARGRCILAHATNPYGDHKIAREHQEVIRNLAKAFFERANLVGLVGWRRDCEALAYFIGASTAFKAIGMIPLSEDVAKIGALEVSQRGFQAIVELTMP